MASDIFLKIEGVEGESVDGKHKGQIEVLSYSWGASNPVQHGQSAGLGAGKVSVQDISFSTTYSKASTKLFLSCCTGEHIKKAQLYHRKAGGGAAAQEFLTYEFTELMVSSYSSSASSDNSIPTDSFSLVFTKVQLEYLGQEADGKVAKPVKVGFNVATNLKI
jgi:type VI secretion system secreted protein Hcp